MGSCKFQLEADPYRRNSKLLIHGTTDHSQILNSILGKPSQTPSVRKVAVSFTRLSYNTKKRSIPLPKFPCKVHTITANIIYPPWLWFCPQKQNPMRVYYHQGPSHQPVFPSCLLFHHYVYHLNIFLSLTPHPGIH